MNVLLHSSVPSRNNIIMARDIHKAGQKRLLS